MWAPPGKTELEWLAKDNPETNPITIKFETVSHVAEQFSWVPLPYCSPPGCPFPIKSLDLLAHVSPRTVHFRVLDKSPVSGPGRGPPSCNKSIGVSASASVLPMNIQDWFPLGWTSWIFFKSKGLSRVFSNTTAQKHWFFGAQLSSLYNSHIHKWPLEKP